LTRLVLAAGGLLFMACSLIVGSEPSPLRCSDEGHVGPPLCDEGQRCHDGVCRALGASRMADAGAAGQAPTSR
jgi:hypothetical protein